MMGLLCVLILFYPYYKRFACFRKYHAASLPQKQKYTLPFGQNVVDCVVAGLYFANLIKFILRIRKA